MAGNHRLGYIIVQQLSGLWVTIALLPGKNRVIINCRLDLTWPLVDFLGSNMMYVSAGLGWMEKLEFVWLSQVPVLLTGELGNISSSDMSSSSVSESWFKMAGKVSWYISGRKVFTLGKREIGCWETKVCGRALSSDFEITWLVKEKAVEDWAWELMSTVEVSCEWWLLVIVKVQATRYLLWIWII